MELNLNELQHNVRHGEPPGASEGVENQSADTLVCYLRPSRPRKTKRTQLCVRKCDK